MEIYFNPYPGPAKTEEEGLRFAIGTADALSRLQKECMDILRPLKASETEGLLPSDFVIFKKTDTELFSIRELMQKQKITKSEHNKLIILLIFFSKREIIYDNDLPNTDNWILSTVDSPASVLELAAKNKAIALTIPTEVEWRVDFLGFKGRTETLHNLWGQENISAIVTHCQDSIKNSLDRFYARFNAKACPGALNSAPNAALWDHFGFFQIMERAQKRNYDVDDNLIKNVDNTKYGSLLELRIFGTGHRIFFVYRRDISPKILIGGFYQKNESLSQDDAIQKAKKCVDNYIESTE
jgi:putative component of toxin-antitoxin plasmid stabilization module